MLSRTGEEQVLFTGDGHELTLWSDGNVLGFDLCYLR
jgi:hypothetical protein